MGSMRLSELEREYRRGMVENTVYVDPATGEIITNARDVYRRLPRDLIPIEYNSFGAQWYRTPRGSLRLKREFREMKIHFPSFFLCEDSYGNLYWIGRLYVNRIPHTLLLGYSQIHPSRPIKAVILYPKGVRTMTHHIYSNGEICYYSPKEPWNPNWTAYFVALRVKALLVGVYEGRI